MTHKDSGVEIDPSILEKEQELYENTPRYTKLPEENGESFSKTGMLKDLVSQLTTGVDMWRVSLPATLLTPVSFLEYICIVAQPTKYVLNVHKEMEPELRFLNVTKWWIENVSVAVAQGICHSKPFNPILGEKFMAKFEHPENGTESYFVAEQVSHHPPVTSVYMVNPKANFTLKGTLSPSTKFYGSSVAMTMSGKIEFVIHGKETYEIQLPQIIGYGLLWGTQRIEINEKMLIKCDQYNLLAEINYKAKQNNKMKGRIYAKGEKLYSLRGVSNEEVTVKSVKTGRARTFVDCSQRKPNNDIKTRPIAQQDEDESRRVWHGVTRELLKKPRNYSEANRIKKAIEEKQRGIRKQREEKGKEWKPAFFELEAPTTPSKKKASPIYRFKYENTKPNTECEWIKKEEFAKYY